VFWLTLRLSLAFLKLHSDTEVLGLGERGQARARTEAAEHRVSQQLLDFPA